MAASCWLDPQRRLTCHVSHYALHNVCPVKTALDCQVMLWVLWYIVCTTVVTYYCGTYYVRTTVVHTMYHILLWYILCTYYCGTYYVPHTTVVHVQQEHQFSSRLFLSKSFSQQACGQMLSLSVNNLPYYSSQASLSGGFACPHCICSPPACFP
jgi:hypothetical protein